ncbi:TolC family protein [Aliivibrio sp. S4TY2]|uniref:TolC family protein n=1 Tax=unclassified Aliivibrio TaxID=2645654 RepID=UPI002379262A|nr:MULTISPECIES: TolC family protein [unclassified Aliivibrio]MDD9157845.1 TolC family protein [Aliivibrio sp. S4TY2]MDD9161803.1 TolC family protein [Aliivibrio sp. S4TY1]MDD9165833.1 TolC family protein [Aliivibrio sp. S4MY2]MDD9169844.1 TolC family protein [Aliivibrio sp. S4MY4]MDD9186837.1 TolC family protein [Aliivibrio sp. S4MY3]
MLKISRLSVLLTTLLSLSVSAKSVDFDSAWKNVLNNHNGIAAERANVQRQESLASGTSDLNLPSITLSANYTYLDDDVTVSSKQIIESTGVSLPVLPIPLPNITSTLSERDIFTSSIRAIWPIFTGGRISAAESAAEGKTDEARSQLKMKQQASYEDLAKYYFSVVLANEVVKTYSEVEQGLAKHRDNAVKLQQQGQIAKVERLQADAAYDKAKVDLRKAQQNSDIASAALRSMLQMNENITPETPLFINQKLPEMTAFIDNTLATYPGLDLLDAKEKQASSLIKAEKGSYYPEVYLYGNYNLYEGDSLSAEIAPDWMVGVGVNVPLLDNKGRSEKVAAAHSAVQQVQYLKKQAKEDLSLLVEKTYREALQAIDEYYGLASSIALAQENILLREKGFKQGLSTSLDVVDAELYLASIKTQRSLASFNYMISLVKLLALSDGTDTFVQYQLQAREGK